MKERVAGTPAPSSSSAGAGRSWVDVHPQCSQDFRIRRRSFALNLHVFEQKRWGARASVGVLTRHHSTPHSAHPLIVGSWCSRMRRLPLDALSIGYEGSDAAAEKAAFRIMKRPGVLWTGTMGGPGGVGVLLVRPAENDEEVRAA